MRPTDKLVPAATALVNLLNTHRKASPYPTPGELDLTARIRDVEAALRDAHRGAIDRASHELVKRFCERGTPPFTLREAAHAAIVAAFGEDVIEAEQARGTIDEQLNRGGLK